MKIPAEAVLSLTCAVAAAWHTPFAIAQNYPTRAVRMIAAVAPGGTTDFLARVLSVKMAERWGVSVVVDNRPGAGGVIAMDIVAKATPDGHTIGITSTMHIVNPSLYPKMPYDTLKDLAGVSKIAVAPLLMIVTAINGQRGQTCDQDIRAGTSAAGADATINVGLFSALHRKVRIAGLTFPAALAPESHDRRPDPPRPGLTLRAGL